MDPSPLSRLSAELRNRIYELSLTYDAPINMKHIKNNNRITCVCRQTRDESRLMFYASNRFEVVYNPLANGVRDGRNFKTMLKILGTATLGVIQSCKFCKMGNDGGRLLSITIYSGRGAVEEEPWSDLWEKRSSAPNLLTPRGQHLELEVYEHLGFQMFALCENGRFQDIETPHRSQCIFEAGHGKHYDFCALLPQDMSERMSGKRARSPYDLYSFGYPHW